MTTLVFPGQGSQYLGMSRDFYENFKIAKDTFNLVEEVSNIKIKDIIFKNQSDLLNITQYTQLAIFCASISIYKVLKNEVDLSNLNIQFMLGHSLGEYTALTASDSISVEDCIKLLKIRGELMNNASEVGESGMAAIIGLNCDAVDEIIIENNLLIEIANDNSPMQVVVSGRTDNLLSSEKLFIKNGAKKFHKLNVSAAFHSKTMLSAEKKMKSYLNEVTFINPKTSIISNFSAKNTKDHITILECLTKQMSNRVKWVESIKLLERLEEDKIIEIGPGKVLSGLIKRISNSFTFYNINDIVDLKRFIDEF